MSDLLKRYELHRDRKAGEGLKDVLIVVDGITLGSISCSEGRANERDPSFHRCGHTCFGRLPHAPQFGFRGQVATNRKGGPGRVGAAAREILEREDIQNYYETCRGEKS